MKKLLIPLLTVALLLTVCACAGNSGGEDNGGKIEYTWPDVSWLDGIPAYGSGDVSYSEAGTGATISVVDTSYEDYIKYINKLKKNGFSFYNNTGSDDVQENLEPEKGVTQWVCTNGTVYMTVVYVEDSAELFDKYNCNVRIYAYSEKPTTW